MLVTECWNHNIRSHNDAKREEHALASSGEAALFVSEMGYCPRAAILRLAGKEQTHPFDPYVLELFHAGDTWERIIIDAIRADGYIVATQVQVSTMYMRGKIDAVISGLVPRIVELKDTAEHNLRAKDRLPYLAHCYQVLMYGWMYENAHGYEPGEIETYLYYHTRGKSAELRIIQTEGGIQWDGEIAGKLAVGMFEGIHFLEEYNRLVDHFKAFRAREQFPPRYESPFEHRFACTKAVKKLRYPACTMMGHCWPELLETPEPWEEDKWRDGRYVNERTADAEGAGTPGDSTPGGEDQD